jgi:hypothetical protein
VTASQDDLERAKREYAEAQKRAARDAEILALADTVVADSAAARAENGWADAFRSLFRG